MKHLLLTLFVFTICFSLRAQNYQCLQSGVKRYFTNSNGYLRGIRIDSVKILADSTIYYPYHTPRGIYLSNPHLDSAGGSWLGKNVVMRNDGTFLFDNLWNDTVVIKTQANPGDSWVFYKDTTSLYYEANLVSVDTMTVLGGVDSIKVVLIAARNSSGIVTADPVDSFQITLSKNHGFVQVFDLFTFPYHTPDHVYGGGFDYYLDHIIPVGRSIPNQSNSIFSLINFIDPTLAQLYQCNIGDVNEISVCGSCLESLLIGGSYTPVKYMLDTVVSVVVIPGGVTYSYSGWTATSPATTFTPIYSTYPNSGSATVDSTLLFDTTLMPEEYRQSYFWTYSPNDTTYCIVNTLYSVQENFEIDGAEYFGPFEYYAAPSVYKSPLGLLSSYNSSADGVSSSLVNSQNLLYFTRSGISCGSYLTVSVAEINVPNTTITLYPNPATTSLTLQTNFMNPSGTEGQIAITNLLGQTIYAQNTNTDKIQIDVSAFPAGMYFVKVNGSEVRKFIKE